MTDIFQEIQEDLRRDRMRKLWERYSSVIIAIIAIVIVGAAAWSGYGYWRQQQATAASEALQNAIILNEAGHYAEAEVAFLALANTAPRGYRTIALLHAANAAAARDPAAGVAAFDVIASDGHIEGLVRDMALLRAALILVDTSDLPNVIQRVGGLAGGVGPLRNSAREIIALAQLKAGDTAAAHATVTEITQDAGTTPSVRARAEFIRRLTAPAEMPNAPVEPTAGQ